MRSVDDPRVCSRVNGSHNTRDSKYEEVRPSSLFCRTLRYRCLKSRPLHDLEIFANMLKLVDDLKNILLDTTVRQFQLLASIYYRPFSYI